MNSSKYLAIYLGTVALTVAVAIAVTRIYAPKAGSWSDTEFAARSGRTVVTNYMATTTYVDQAVSGKADNTKVVTISAANAARGLTFVDPHGDTHNDAVEIGEGARAAVSQEDMDNAPSNSVVRSVSVAIGAGANAIDPSQPYKSQSLAIGNQARAAGVNSVAIGSGVKHVDEDDMSGGNAYAMGAQAVAIGYTAKATAQSAIQIGPGTNSVANSFKVNDTYLMKNNKLVVPKADMDAAARRALDTATGNRLAMIEQPPVTSNGYAAVHISSYSDEGDYESGFIIVVNTNDADSATMEIGLRNEGPRVEVYKTTTIDTFLTNILKRIEALENK